MSDSETYYALYDIYNQLIPRVLHILCSPSYGQHKHGYESTCTYNNVTGIYIKQTNKILLPDTWDL